MNPKCLPKWLYNKEKIEWHTTIPKKDEAPNLPNFYPGEAITSTLIEINFHISTDFLKSSVCFYVWEKYIRQEE